MLIRFFADISELTLEDERQWSRQEATLGDLLTDLSELYGPRFEHQVFEDDGKQLNESVIVLVNGGNVRHQGALKAPLRPNDTVAIFPVFVNGKSE